MNKVVHACLHARSREKKWKSDATLRPKIFCRLLGHNSRVLLQLLRTLIPIPLARLIDAILDILVFGLIARREIDRTFLQFLFFFEQGFNKFLNTRFDRRLYLSFVVVKLPNFCTAHVSYIILLVNRAHIIPSLIEKIKIIY